MIVVAREISREATRSANSREGASFVPDSVGALPLTRSIMSSHLDLIAADNDAHDGHDGQQDRDTNPGLRLALDLRGALAAHDDDADTASQHSISFTSSSAASPHGSLNVPEFAVYDTSRRQSNPHTTSTESSEGPDDISLYNGRASSVTSHGEHPLDGNAKRIPPTPLTAALRDNVYPPSSPACSSVASLATSNSSYSRKARPESLLVDPSNGPLVLGIALVDFNHQVRRYYLVVATVTHHTSGGPADTVFCWGHL